LSNPESTTVALLTRALDSVMPPETRRAVLQAAARRARQSLPPIEPDALIEFASGPLLQEMASVVGTDVAREVLDELVRRLGALDTVPPADRPSQSRKLSPTPYPPQTVACRCASPEPVESKHGYVECAVCGFLVRAPRA
jgi:hypothetical protein